MILIEDVHKVFDLWIDKTQSPYFTSDEKDIFIQRALYNLINKYFIESPSHVAERTMRDVEDLSELLVEVSAKTDSTGRLTDAVTQAALGDRPIMYVMNASYSNDCGESFVKARFMRHNDYFAQFNNSFKKPEFSYPVYRFFNGYTKFDPEGVNDVKMTVIIEPNKPTLDDPTSSGVRGGNAVNVEVSENLFNELVYLALTEAGVSMREGDFHQMVSQETMKNE